MSEENSQMREIPMSARRALPRIKSPLDSLNLREGMGGLRDLSKKGNFWALLASISISELLRIYHPQGSISEFFFYNKY